MTSPAPEEVIPKDPKIRKSEISEGNNAPKPDVIPICIYPSEKPSPPSTTDRLSETTEYRRQKVHKALAD